MKTTNGKFLYFFGITCLLLLPNHAIIDWLFNGTILAVWKQLLFLILNSFGFIYLFGIRHTNSKFRIIPFKIIYLVSILSTSILIIFTFAVGFSAYRIFYAAIFYMGFIGAISFSLYAIRAQKVEEIIKIIFFIGIACALGIIVDYFTDLFVFLPASGGLSIDENIEGGFFRRASFFFGTSTVIFPFLSSSLVFSSILAIYKADVKYKRLYFLFCVVSLISMFLTGSRTQLLLYGILVLLTFLVFVINHKRNIRFSLPILLIFLYFVINFAGQDSDSQQLIDLMARFLDPFDSSEAGNSTRYQSWSDGLMVINNFDYTKLFGIGIGSSFGMVDDGMISTRHYESTLLMVFADAGFMGLLIVYMPFFYAVYHLMVMRPSNPSIRVLLLGWFLLFFISILVAPTGLAYHTTFIYYLMTGFAINIVVFERSLEDRSI